VVVITIVFLLAGILYIKSLEEHHSEYQYLGIVTDSIKQADDLFVIDEIENLEDVPSEEPIDTYNETIEIPSLNNKDSSFKSYMDYRTITDRTSKQWGLQQKAYTDSNGLRRVGNYYCVALGTSLGGQVGDVFGITFDNGSRIEVILADIKDDRHTDTSNSFVELGGDRVNVVEFIVDTHRLPYLARVMGDISYIGYGFEGHILQVERIGAI
jgi:hypothetical protein